MSGKIIRKNHAPIFLFMMLHQIMYTECPTDMLTISDSILQFLKPHISKSKTCFENLVKKIFQIAP